MSRADARRAYDAVVDASTRDAAAMERFAALATAPSAVARAAVEDVVDAVAARDRARRSWTCDRRESTREDACRAR